MECIMQNAVLSRAWIIALVVLLMIVACSDDESTPVSPPDEPTTYRVLYDANGADAGEAPVDSDRYEAGDVAVVAGPGTLSRTGHVFAAWAHNEAGDGTHVVAGATLTMGAADLELFAVWEEESSEPGGWDPTRGAWDYLGGAAGAASAGAAVEYCRFDLDPAGQPVAAYHLTSPGGEEPSQQVARWNGSTFDVLGGSPVLMHGVRWFFDIACDGAGHVWMITTTSQDDGVVTRHDGEAWSLPEYMTDDNTTYQPAITLDQDGRPMLAFRYRPQDTSLLGVRRWDGTLWQAYPDLVTTTDNNLAMAVIDDEPWVMYANNLQYGHVVRHVEGSGWLAVGASPMHPSNSVNSYAMAVDSQGQPWVVYRQGGDVHVRWFDGEDWVAMDTAQLRDVVDVSSTPDTMDIVLVDDVPVICFVSTESPRGIRVLARADDTWVPLAGVEPTAARGARFPQLRLGADGCIFLAHRDIDAGGAMSIQVYTPGD
jgi:hypothetical protein